MFLSEQILLLLPVHTLLSVAKMFFGVLFLLPDVLEQEATSEEGLLFSGERSLSSVESTSDREYLAGDLWRDLEGLMQWGLRASVSGLSGSVLVRL